MKAMTPLMASWEAIEGQDRDVSFEQDGLLSLAFPSELSSFIACPSALKMPFGTESFSNCRAEREMTQSTDEGSLGRMPTDNGDYRAPVEP